MVKIFAFFQSLLYLISNLLFYPVIVLLVFLFFYTVYKAGAFAGEFLRRRSGKRPFYEGFCKELSLLSGAGEAEVENLLQIWTERMTAETDKLRILVRVGPSLGLMGTLIPMGTGLAALARGQMEQLISNMIVAFTTTVVGLAVAVMAYFMGVVKQRWLDEEMRLMEYRAELFVREGSEVSKKEKETLRD